MEEKTIGAQPITAENFAPYGVVFDAKQLQYEGDISFFNAVAQMGFAPAEKLDFSLLHLEPRKMEAQAFERHMHSDEGFVGFDQDVIAYYAEDSDGTVDPAAVVAFWIPQGCIFAVARGVWHSCPLVRAGTTGVVLNAAGTFARDMQQLKLARPVPIQYDSKGWSSNG